VRGEEGENWVNIAECRDQCSALLKAVVPKRRGIRPITGPMCPEGSRKLRFPDCVAMAQDGGKVVSLTHRPLLPPENTPGTHFCQRLSRPQGHSAIGRIISMKNSNDTIWNLTNDLSICSTAP